MPPVYRFTSPQGGVSGCPIGHKPPWQQPACWAEHCLAGAYYAESPKKCSAQPWHPSSWCSGWQCYGNCDIIASQLLYDMAVAAPPDPSEAGLSPGQGAAPVESAWR